MLNDQYFYNTIKPNKVCRESFAFVLFKGPWIHLTFKVFCAMMWEWCIKTCRSSQDKVTLRQGTHSFNSNGFSTGIRPWKNPDVCHINWSLYTDLEVYFCNTCALLCVMLTYYIFFVAAFSIAYDSFFTGMHCSGLVHISWPQLLIGTALPFKRRQAIAWTNDNMLWQEMIGQDSLQIFNIYIFVSNIN